MIFITGDTHIPIDVKKLGTRSFPLQKELTKSDYVIICGDFGGVWNNDSEEMYWRKWLESKSFTTAGPMPSIFMASREAKCSILRSICAGQELVFVHLVAASPFVLETGSPQEGQSEGISKGSSAPVRSSLQTETISGIMSPAF